MGHAMERANQLPGRDLDACLLEHLAHRSIRMALARLDPAADGQPVGLRRLGRIPTEQEEDLAVSVHRQDPC